MLRKHRRSAPDADAPDLFAHAAEREARNAAIAEIPASVPEPSAASPESLAQVRVEADACMRCPLYRDATQTVFGEGSAHAGIMLVGEQPGDQEDLDGRPFVGPAGKMLDRALHEAGIDRRMLYVTNAVKHFKFERRGKKRIHQKPNNGEVDICRWWLDRERRLVKPRVIVALGATAIRGVTGRSASISSLRGKPSRLEDGSELVATIHPSYLLRLPDAEAAEREFARLVEDLRLAAGMAAA